MVSLKKTSDMIKVFYLILDKRLSVRLTEQLIDGYYKKQLKKKFILPIDINEIEMDLSNYIQSNANIKIYVKTTFLHGHSCLLIEKNCRC